MRARKRVCDKGEPLIPVVRNGAEIGVIVLWWVIVLALIRNGVFATTTFSVLIVIGCLLKTAFFGLENAQQLRYAAKHNISHHRFLVWMSVNMAQMIMSFAFDFHCLYKLNPGSFAGIAKDIDPNEALFDCFYLSTLNFSFFGYSDILPQTVPAKLVNLTEILIAFVTVIFLLSDFMSLKESIATDSSDRKE